MPFLDVGELVTPTLDLRKCQYGVGAAWCGGDSNSSTTALGISFPGGG